MEMSIEPTLRRRLHGFRILRAARAGPGERAAVPPDRATCAACRREVFDPADRRFGYPFTNCTACGPRYSIIERLPYDRPRTRHGRLRPVRRLPGGVRRPRRPPLPRPADRLPGAAGRGSACGTRRARAVAAGPMPSGPRRSRCGRGRSSPSRGWAAFQLLVRADRLRAGRAACAQRKGRPTKPLAVMVPRPRAAPHGSCVIGADGASPAREPREPDRAARARLPGPGRPCSRHEVAPRLRAGSACSCRRRRCTTCCSPDCDFPVVATSGNRSEEPIVTDECDRADEAWRRRRRLPRHDRPIVRRVDDSVVRVVAGRPVTIRLARGYAPRRRCRPWSAGRTAAERCPADPGGRRTAEGGRRALDRDAGRARRRTSATWTAPRRGRPSPRLVQELGRSVRLSSPQPGLRPAPRLLHARAGPRNRACRWSRCSITTPTRSAVMVEHDLLDRRCWPSPGTAPATARTARSGAARCCGPAWIGFERVASLRPFPLPGGEAAIREPARVALGLLGRALGEDAVLADADLLGRLGSDPARRPGPAADGPPGRQHAVDVERGPAVRRRRALLCLGAGVSYEGEAAAWLEAVADPTGDRRLCRCDGRAPRAGPTASAVIASHAWRPSPTWAISAAAIAARFHNALAGWAAAVAERHSGSARRPRRRLFPESAAAGADDRGHPGDARAGGSTMPGAIPPGDGGLAVGQLRRWRWRESGDIANEESDSCVSESRAGWSSGWVETDGLAFAAGRVRRPAAAGLHACVPERRAGRLRHRPRRHRHQPHRRRRGRASCLPRERRRDDCGEAGESAMKYLDEYRDPSWPSGCSAPSAAR